MGTKFLDLSGTQFIVDHLKADIAGVQEDTYRLTNSLKDTVSSYSCITDELKTRIEMLEEQVAAACANVDLLRSQMDALADKPKQKYLWEIFEPNDLDIDFPYIL